MYSITLFQIEAFLTVSEQLNISQAAKLLNTSQPSLSQTINRVESVMDIKLFKRSQHGVMLTKEGQRLYQELRPSYTRMCRAIENIVTKHNEDTEILRIACHLARISSDPHSCFERLIKQYKDKYPDVVIAEELFEFRELKQALVNAHVDIICISSFALENMNMENISIKKVVQHEFYLAVSEQHPMAKNDRLDISSLNNEIFYFVNDTKGMINSPLNRCKQMGFVPKEVRYMPNYASVLMAVKQGDGMTLCGYRANSPFVSGIKFLRIGILPDSPYLVVAWRTNDASEATMNFIKMIPEIH